MPIFYLFPCHIMNICVYISCMIFFSIRTFKFQSDLPTKFNYFISYNNLIRFKILYMYLPPWPSKSVHITVTKSDFNAVTGLFSEHTCSKVVVFKITSVAIILIVSWSKEKQTKLNVNVYITCCLRNKCRLFEHC